MSSIRKKTKEEFIQDARKVWGDQYDYSQVDYVNSKTKVLIRCIKHDETFPQTPFAHNIMKRQGCPKCQEFRKKSIKYKKHLPIIKYDDYIKEWDYEKNKDRNPETLTVGTSYKVWWKCSVCGHSWQASPNDRILQGSNCPICSLKNVNAERIKGKEVLQRIFQKEQKIGITIRMVSFYLLKLLRDQILRYIGNAMFAVMSGKVWSFRMQKQNLLAKNAPTERSL